MRVHVCVWEPAYVRIYWDDMQNRIDDEGITSDSTYSNHTYNKTTQVDVGLISIRCRERYRADFELSDCFYLDSVLIM